MRAAHGVDGDRRGTLSYEDILYEVGGGRATITINRPDRLNAFRVQTIGELCEAFEAAADDEAVGVIVFTGAGERAFCVGGDVRAPTRTAAEKRHLHHLHDRLAVAIRNNGKPIIVRVRGYCIGGGNELNVLCDLTITGASGRFGQAGPRIGSAPAVVGLPADAGGGGREEGARDPLPHPPVHRRRGAGDGAGERGGARRGARRRGRPLVHGDPAPLPQGLRLAKIALNAATDQLYSAVQHGLELVALNHVYGPEPSEGIASFQEKRPADWRKFRDGAGPRALRQVSR